MEPPISWNILEGLSDQKSLSRSGQAFNHGSSWRYIIWRSWSLTEDLWDVFRIHTPKGLSVPTSLVAPLLLQCFVVNTTSAMGGFEDQTEEFQEGRGVQRTWRNRWFLVRFFNRWGATQPHIPHIAPGNYESPIRRYPKYLMAFIGSEMFIIVVIINHCHFPIEFGLISEYPPLKRRHRSQDFRCENADWTSPGSDGLWIRAPS